MDPTDGRLVGEWRRGRESARRSEYFIYGEEEEEEEEEEARMEATRADPRPLRAPPQGVSQCPDARDPPFASNRFVRQEQPRRGYAGRGASNGDRRATIVLAAAAPPVAASAAAIAHGVDAMPVTTATTPSPQQRKRGRVCRTDGCDNYIVYRGLCCRHGGGKKCSVDGCDTSAKHKGLCWKHGKSCGSTKCKIAGCEKRAKAKGVCWSHGGGTQCSHAACSTIAVSGGFCWAHGGGKRCIYDGCQRPAFERTLSFCTKHFTELQGVNYYEV